MIRRFEMKCCVLDSWAYHSVSVILLLLLFLSWLFAGIGNPQTHILHVEGLPVKMSQDVEMEDRQTPASSADSSAGPSALGHLRGIVWLIKYGSNTGDVRLIVRAVHLTFRLRRKLTAPLLSKFLDFELMPGSEAHSRLSAFLPKEDEYDMDVDTETSALRAPTKHLLAELEIYCSSLIVLFLIDQKKYNEKGMEKALRPYFEVTNAVRIADLELFQSVAEKFTSTFRADKTQNLIVRLRYNVIRSGLRYQAPVFASPVEHPKRKKPN